MKRLVLSFMMLTSISSFANEIKLTSGLYVTGAALLCDMNVVQTDKELICEYTETPRKRCLDSGYVFRAKKVSPNNYKYVYLDSTGKEVIAKIEIHGPKNLTFNQFNRDRFYKLDESKIGPLKSNFQSKAQRLWSMNDNSFYYQGVAGFGRCQIVECTDGTLDLHRNNHGSCESKLEQNLSEKAPLAGADAISRRLFNFINNDAC